MWSDHRINLSWRAAVAVISFALPFQILAFAGGVFAQTSVGPAAPGAPAASAQPPSAQALKNWRDGMTHAPPPEKGCFTLSYPNTKWQQVPCQAGPAHPFLPARGPRPSTVGNGNDVAAGTTGQISLAIGSFDSVSGVTSVTGEFGSNDYSLQLNTDRFITPICSGAGTPANCRGWQQFVYSNNGCTNSSGQVPCVFIQYWLLGWGSTTCPSSGGWTFFQNGSDDECVTNSNVVVPPQQPLSNLGNLAVIAEANSGGMDAVIFSTGTALYVVQNNDNVLDLAGNWSALEYNIVGDGNGTVSTFNNGAAVVVRASIDNGGSTLPSCVSNTFTGYTGETNNLNFASPPAAQQGTLPALAFAQSSAGGVGSPCGSAISLQQSSSLLLAAVLPESRSARVGGTVTAFAAIINAGPNPVAGCSIAPLSGLPGSFVYQTTNPSTNAVTGSPDTPVVIPGNNQFQTFVIAFTPSAAFAPTNSVYSFSCSDVPAAPIVTGLDTLLLSASTTPTPDVIALGATLQNDGIVHVTGTPMQGVFAVAADNLGSGDTITVATNTGGVTLPITVSLCQTNPTTGACLQTPSATVSTTINSNATPTFGIFVSASAAVPFNPANNRIFVTFTDSTNAIRGETSVAVETQ
jgi:hypothetical protein